MSDLIEEGQLSFFDLEPLIMPSEFIGTHRQSGGYTKTTPREWTTEELNWVIEKRQQGYSVEMLAEATGRSAVSLQVKLKRKLKIDDSYNTKNRETKYLTNKHYFEDVQPKSVLDLFAGKSWWKTQDISQVITNDIDPKFITDYSEDALKLLCQLYSQGKKFDVIDLDPYGSAFDCFDLAIKMATKGIVISFGEWGHKRWKRLDFVEPRYGIKQLEDFKDGSPFIAEIERIARCNKKAVEVLYSLKYENFIRIYFKITQIKITTQWEAK